MGGPERGGIEDRQTAVNEGDVDGGAVWAAFAAIAEASRRRAAVDEPASRRSIQRSG